MAKQKKDNLESYCKKYQLTQQMVCLGILLANDIQEEIAFINIFPGISKNEAKKMFKRFMEDNPTLETFVEDYKKERTPTFEFIETEEGGQGGYNFGSFNLREKDGVINALTVEANNARDPKQRAEIITKIADIQRMKQQEDAEREKLVHYYLPLRCEVCPWKKSK